MFAGRVDRSGGREGKKSLRKNKIAIKDMQKNQTGASQTNEGKTAPPRLCALTPESLFDCGCGLVNRKFENDQLKVIERAKRLNVPVMLAMTNDFEKQEDLLKLTAEHKGNVYALVGIHPDTVKRMNEKLFAQRLAQLIVGLFCGLDFSRDVGSHYAQEKLLNAQLELSAQLGIPSVISQTSAHEKLVEIVLQHAANLPAIGLFNFSAASEVELGSWLAINEQLPVYFILTGLITEKNEKILAFRTLQRLPQLPADRILIASDSPFYTPQNIDDVWIRENRNEPSNLDALLKLLSEVRGVTKQALTAQLRANSKQFFSLREEGELTDAEETEEVLRQLQDAKELEEQVQNAELEAAVAAAEEAEAAEEAAEAEEVVPPMPAAKSRNENPPQSRKPAAATPLKSKAARRERRAQRIEEELDSDDEGEDDNRKGRGNRKGQREPQRMVVVLKPKPKEKPASAVVAASPPKKSSAEESRKGDSGEKEEQIEADDAAEEEEDLEVSGYACRVCRSVLFGPDDISPHQHGGGVETCQAVFLKTVPAALKSSEGKLLCAKCDAKIGRTANTPLPCSCGALQSGATASVTVKKKAIDLLSNQMGALEIAEYNDDRGPKKKKAEKRKGPAKKSTSNFSSFRNKDTK